MNVTVALFGLIIVIGVHIAVIARWSGKIDGFIIATMARISTVENEVTRLRDARHVADGILQRHDGAIEELKRRSAEGS